MAIAETEPSTIPSIKKSNFVFITYDNQNGWHHDRETRRIVRKRAFDSSRHGKPPEVEADSSKTSSKSLQERQYRFRLPKQPQNAINQPQLPRSLSQLDPTLKRLGSDTYRILGYCQLQLCPFPAQLLTAADHHAFRQNSLAINLEGNWLAFTLTDATVTHAQLALTALSLDATSPDKASYLKHSSASMRLIRDKLSNNTEPNDTIMGAVALLLIAEVRNTESGPF
jgi:hypothetical protein